METAGTLNEEGTETAGITEEGTETVVRTVIVTNLVTVNCMIKNCFLEILCCRVFDVEGNALYIPAVRDKRGFHDATSRVPYSRTGNQQCVLIRSCYLKPETDEIVEIPCYGYLEIDIWRCINLLRYQPEKRYSDTF